MVYGFVGTVHSLPGNAGTFLGTLFRVCWGSLWLVRACCGLPGLDRACQGLSGLVGACQGLSVLFVVASWVVCNICW